MKKNFLVIVIIYCLVFVLISCDNNKHSHNYGEWYIVTPATCISTGVREKRCECGDICTQTIPSLGHNYSSGVCTDCGEFE